MWALTRLWEPRLALTHRADGQLLSARISWRSVGVFTGSGCRSEIRGRRFATAGSRLPLGPWIAALQMSFLSCKILRSCLVVGGGGEENKKPGHMRRCFLEGLSLCIISPKQLLHKFKGMLRRKTEGYFAPILLSSAPQLPANVI